MTDYEITITKETFRGEPRVVFNGINYTQLPPEKDAKIEEEIRERFDMSEVDDDTELATVYVTDEPERKVESVEYYDG